MSHGKRYQTEKKAVEPGKTYSAEEAIEFLKENSKTKFDQSLELHMHLNIDPSQGSQMVRGTVVLPAKTGKSKRIAVFCVSSKEKEAKAAGAEVIGGEELIKEIKQKKKIDFDVAVAEPAMMKFLGQIAPILGPKGLMPNPKTETVTPDVAKAVKELQGGKIDFRMDNGGNIHQMLGKISFDTKDLLSNVESFLEAVKKSEPTKLKGEFIGKVVLTTTMGPAVKIKM